ncbi:MAG: transglycosylase SLT domain-containing protein [Bacteroidales bacterium]
MKKTIICTLIAIATATGITKAVSYLSDIELPRDTITDSEMVIIESIENEADTILSNWFLQKFTDLDSDCISRSENIQYDDTTYIKRLSSLPTLIDMPYNQIVKEYINIYTGKRRKLVESMLGFSLYYFPIFEHALEKEELPLELKYLPIIESALRPNAVSRAGATGLWQIMLKTARTLGMEVNSLVDERRSPIASSEAAARYLKQLYNMYQDWPLAIAAYNCGPGNINKAIHRSGGKKDYWSIYPFLPRETRGYLPAFIAANYVMNYYDKHNICPVSAQIPLVTDTIRINKRVNLKQIAAVLNTSIDMLRELNPQYRCDIIPDNDKAYHLMLPIQLTYAYIDSRDSILNYQAENYARLNTVEPSQYTSYPQKAVSHRKYHKVKRGETLSTIANRYNMSVTTLKKLNGLHGNTIQAGKQLKLNKATKYIASATEKTITTTTTQDTNNSSKTTKQPLANNTKAKYHKVTTGDTLGKIAMQYGIKTDQLKKVNKLNTTIIKVGQLLKIPVT